MAEDTQMLMFDALDSQKFDFSPTRTFGSTTRRSIMRSQSSDLDSTQETIKRVDSEGSTTSTTLLTKNLMTPTTSQLTSQRTEISNFQFTPTTSMDQSSEDETVVKKSVPQVQKKQPASLNSDMTLTSSMNSHLSALEDEYKIVLEKSTFYNLQVYQKGKLLDVIHDSDVTKSEYTSKEQFLNTPFTAKILKILQAKVAAKIEESSLKNSATAETEFEKNLLQQAADLKLDEMPHWLNKYLDGSLFLAKNKPKTTCKDLDSTILKSKSVEKTRVENTCLESALPETNLQNEYTTVINNLPSSPTVTVRLRGTQKISDLILALFGI